MTSDSSLTGKIGRTALANGTAAARQAGGKKKTPNAESEGGQVLISEET